MKLFTNSLVIILFSAALIRIILLYFSVTIPFDLNGDQMRYEDWAQTAHIYGINSTYDHGFVKIIPNTQPPGTQYVLSATYEAYNIVGKVINKLTHTSPGSLNWVNITLLHGFMRIPEIITDLLIGLLIYFLVKKEKNKKLALISSSLFLFNPITIYNSVFWGQTDSITNFFFIFSLFLAFRKNVFLSIFVFAISIYIKLSILPLFPFLLIFLYFNTGKNWKRILVSMFTSVILLIMFTYPINHSPIKFFMEKYSYFTIGETQNITNAAFNFWWAIPCTKLLCLREMQSYDTLIKVPLGIWAYLLFAIVTLPLLYFQIIKQKLFIKKGYFFLLLSLISFAMFMFMPRMHDRYLYPFFPLFSVGLVFSKNLKKYLSFFFIISFLHFLNLTASWYPTRFPNLTFYHIVYNSSYRSLIAILTLIIGFVIYREIMKFFSKKSD